MKIKLKVFKQLYHTVGDKLGTLPRPLHTPIGIKSDPSPPPNGLLGEFYLKPTCVGLSSVRPFALRNGSRYCNVTYCAVLYCTVLCCAVM